MKLLRVDALVGNCNPTAGVGVPLVMQGGSEQIGQQKVTRLAYQVRDSILNECHFNHSPIASTRLINKARKGRARWEGNKLVFGAFGPYAYWYLPAVEECVSYCVVPADTGASHVYVVSDQYGGCEYHELLNPSTQEMAFLHVYKGKYKTRSGPEKSGAIGYNLIAPWTLLRKMLSTDFTSTLPTNQAKLPGSVWSVSYIDRSEAIPMARSQFLCQKDGVVLHVQNYGIAQ